MSTIQSAIQKRRRRGPHESQPSSRDASEEDNDESPLSPPTGTGARPHHPIPHSPMRPKKVDIPPFNVSDDAGSDDAGADGDIDSSSTSVANHPIDPIVPKSPPTPSSSSFTTNLPDPTQRGTTPTPPEPSKATTPSPPSPAPLPTTPVIVQLPQEDIRAFVQRAIDGVEEPGIVVRSFQVNEPPTDRPVRIYADGVYDLFHYGHALQMRQAKLCFPSVHLIIGVCSDELCKSHKALPALTHTERCESVKHCRWVDEVAPDAPWELTQEFIDEHRIDYVAHDEEPYAVAGKADLYDFVKKQGKFLPTRRTPGISTSDLLERIVSEYRDGMFDGKLSKNGHPELRADLVDWSSRVSSASST